MAPLLRPVAEDIVDALCERLDSDPSDHIKATALSCKKRMHVGAYSELRTRGPVVTQNLTAESRSLPAVALTQLAVEREALTELVAWQFEFGEDETTLLEACRYLASLNRPPRRLLSSVQIL